MRDVSAFYFLCRAWVVTIGVRVAKTQQLVATTEVVVVLDRIAATICWEVAVKQEVNVVALSVVST